MSNHLISIFVENRNKMKRLLFIAFILITTFTHAQKIGVLDKNVTAIDTLETESNFIVANDTVVPILDVAYIEYSTDAVTWTKDTTGANYMRVSVDVKNTWYEIDLDAFNVYWELSGDSLKPIGAYILTSDSIYGGKIASDTYFLGSDTLALTNIYSGSGTDNYVLTRQGDVAVWLPTASGDRSTARNVGVDGYGVFEDSLLSELQFRNIAPNDTFINVSLADSTIYLTWDGSGRRMTAGAGLSGGGALDNDITINLYIPELLELTSLSYLDKGNDFIPIYDNSAAQHKKINPVYLHPDIFVNDVKEEEAPQFFNFIAGDNITIASDGSGGIIINSGVTAALPTCAEGEFLAYIGGQWTCVNVCDYICADTIINIINTYEDTATYVEPSGDVVLNFSRLDCEDSTQVLATDLAESTLNLTSIKIVTVPTVGELHYNGVAVIGGQELSVTLGSLDTALYYLSDASTGSAYSDLFTFQLLYSSNADYLDTANVDVSVDACVTERVGCFGYLYNWYAVDTATTGTDIAADGWWVPTESEFQSLETHLGGGATAAGKLIQPSLLYWNDVSGATNESGFSARGSGERNTDGTFDGLKAAFIITFVTKGLSGRNRGAVIVSGGIVYTNLYYEEGHAIRLVSDATGIPDGTTTTYTGNDGKVYNAVAINGLYWTTENLEETKYRNGDYIQGYDGGNYTPIDNTTWAGLTTGALSVYNDDLNNACKDVGVAVTEYCYSGLYLCGDPAHVIEGQEPKTGSVTYTDAYGNTITEYYCADDGVISVYSSTVPVTVGMSPETCP